jgi:hypothetical protein
VNEAGGNRPTSLEVQLQDTRPGGFSCLHALVTVRYQDTMLSSTNDFFRQVCPLCCPSTHPVVSILAAEINFMLFAGLLRLRADAPVHHSSRTKIQFRYSRCSCGIERKPHIKWSSGARSTAKAVIPSVISTHEWDVLHREHTLKRPQHNSKSCRNFQGSEERVTELTSCHNGMNCAVQEMQQR